MRPGPCVYRTEWTAVGMPPRGPHMETMVPPVAIRRNVGFDVFNVRLLIGLDKLLRAKRRYQGDLSASINDALLAVNLNTAPNQGYLRQNEFCGAAAIIRSSCDSHWSPRRPHGKVLRRHTL